MHCIDTSSISSSTKSVLKDSQGRFRTQTLFWEFRSDKYPFLFTTKDDDIEVNGTIIPSLKKIYFSYDHVPEKEYSFANEVLGGWLHWEALTKNKLFSDMITQWRYELDLRIQEEAIKSLMAASREEGAKGVAAAKYLADKGYKGIRGRPSKAEVERERKQQAAIAKEFEEDFERIGLKLINGDKQ